MRDFRNRRHDGVCKYEVCCPSKREATLEEKRCTCLQSPIAIDAIGDNGNDDSMLLEFATEETQGLVTMITHP